MRSVPQVQLVSIDGRPIGADDQGNASTWPSWTDHFFWECEPAVMAELEAAAIAAECDRRDAVDPPASQISDVEWSMLNGGLPLG